MFLFKKDGNYPFQDIIEAKFKSKTEELLFETGEFTYMMNLAEGLNDELCQVGNKSH